MENLLGYVDLAPMIGMLQLNVLNLTKTVQVRDERIAQLEEENAILRGQVAKKNGKVKEASVG